MQINRLELKNFRGFSEREFHFHPQFNLIVGENGSGKTALLEALSIAAGSWFLGLKDKFDVRHIHYNDVSFVWNEKYGKPGSPQYPCSILAEGEIIEQNLSWQRTKGSKKGRTTQKYAQQIHKLSSEADAKVRSNKSVSLPLISYYGTERLWQNPRQTATKSHLSQRLLGYETSVDSRIDKKALLLWWKDTEYEHHMISEQRDFILVKDVLVNTLEHCTKIQYMPKIKDIVIDFEDGKKCLSHMSDGYRNLFFLVLDIAKKAITLNHSEWGENTLKETKGVVLIDELDMHLHPKWQRQIIEILRTTFPKIQFFCTTHSPFLIQSLRSRAELLFLNPEKVEDVVLPLPNQSIDKIAERIQNVEVDYSKRYEEMKQVATEYLTELHQHNMTPQEELAQFKQRLAEKIAPYADNPAFQAFLELERLANLGE